MPNGRSGGFKLKRIVLEQVLQAYAGHELVGERRREPVTAGEMLRALRESRPEEVLIEEQDHSRYIVHLAQWITVDDKSPLFTEFRKHHVEWQKQWWEEWKRKETPIP